MKNKIIITTLALLTMLTIGSSFFVALGSRNSPIATTYLLPISNNISITDKKTSGIPLGKKKLFISALPILKTELAHLPTLLGFQ